jgi:hypothetical protein
VDLARLLTALEGSRGKRLISEESFKRMLGPPPDPLRPRPDGSFVGLGWDLVRPSREGTGYAKDALLPGIRTFMGRKPNGVSWVVLFNSGEELTPLELAADFDPKKEIKQPVHQTRKWPDVDYFKEFR